ncbi:hypothetical protein [Streptomyces zaomyceticus]|uniref:hypothetical protein n=1 Tax=Streptomyces zaomyceticus TaxID=68286 RepID=UPI0016727E9E|nr:hypothetical protein [Streptomyces zaomyceticus]GHG17880.1 hypothetical protein GCM10018791_35770 [Streptomyces zaomyceticus]
MNARPNVATGPVAAMAMKHTVAASSALAESTARRRRTRRPGDGRGGHPRRRGGRPVPDAARAHAATYDDEQVVHRPARHH